MIKITKAGWIYISLTILLGIAAVNTGNNLVYLIEAAMLSFMIISGFFGKKNLSGLDLEIDLPEEIFAGVEFPVKVKLKNKKRFFPSFLVVFHFEDKRFVVPYIDPKGSFVFHINHTYKKRGKFYLREFNICSVFPFNFFIRCVVYMKKIPVVVYPFPRRCIFPYDHSRSGKSEGTIYSDRRGYQGDMISIRDYTEGDPLKYIHWKASVKTGKLKTKELGEISQRPVVIDLDAIEGDMERKVSCGAYLIIELYKASVPFGLKYGKKFYRPECSRKHKALLLGELAQIK